MEGWLGNYLVKYFYQKAVIFQLLTVMRRFVIALLTVPVVRLQQDLYQQQHRLQTNSG